MLENTLVKFLHLLAHHPDFSTDVADLHMFARYVAPISLSFKSVFIEPMNLRQ